jgi:peroxiredoxin
MKRLGLSIVSIALFLLLGGVPYHSVFGQGSYPKAPDFQVTDLNGKSISLADYKGKVLFLNFWATWCPPCRAEIPDFVEVYGQNKSKGFEIIGISLDTNGKDAVAAFVEKYKINYPIVLESRNTTQKIIADYEPGQYIPTTIVIDKQGRIRGKEVGAMDKQMLLKYFSQLSAE